VTQLAYRAASRLRAVAFQRLRLGLPFVEEITRVSGQIMVSVDAAGWPDHFDLLDTIGAGKTEMEPGIAGRLIAATTDTRDDLATSAGLERDLGPDAITVGWLPDQPERREMTRALTVVEIGEGLILGDDDQIDSTVVFQVSGSQSPTHSKPSRAISATAGSASTTPPPSIAPSRSSTTRPCRPSAATKGAECSSSASAPAWARR
jgi:hypothetical protein